MVVLSLCPEAGAEARDAGIRHDPPSRCLNPASQLVHLRTLRKSSISLAQRAERRSPIHTFGGWKLGFGDMG
jgi:hypothetical protein